VKNFLKWLNRNKIDYELYDKTGRGYIAFMLPENELKVRNYIKRSKSNLKLEFTAHYTWLKVWEE